MSASETKNKCKRYDHAFRFNETKRPLQRSKELCEFVFSSGLINVNKLIDVTQLDIPLCNACYQFYCRQIRSTSFISAEESMETDSGNRSKIFVDTSSQTDDLNVISLTRSASINMIVDSPATTLVGASETRDAPIIASTLISLSSIASHVSIPFYRLSASHARCSVCDVDSSSNSSGSVFSYDIRTRAFLKHDILISFGTRCCTRHISDSYLNAAALQRVRKKEKKCYLTVDELMNIFVVVKDEFLLKPSIIENLNNAPPLNYDDLTSLTSKNYYVLTGLSRSDFGNLCSRIPSMALRNTQNRSTRNCSRLLINETTIGN